MVKGWCMMWVLCGCRHKVKEFQEGRGQEAMAALKFGCGFGAGLPLRVGVRVKGCGWGMM